MREPPQAPREAGDGTRAFAERALPETGDAPCQRAFASIPSIWALQQDLAFRLDGEGCSVVPRSRGGGTEAQCGERHEPPVREGPGPPHVQQNAEVMRTA